MILSHQGEFAALATAFCWMVTAMSFEWAGKRVGSLPVNIIRLVLAFVFLSFFNWYFRGLPLPTDASTHAWLWLSLSAVAGFLIGDLSLFRAFVVIGSRLSMLIMALVPPLTALIGWMLLGETLTMRDLIGMALTFFGVSWVILERKPAADGQSRNLPIQGIALALLGALGQAVGLVFSKMGMGDYNPFAATQIRIITGVIGFALIFSIFGIWPRVFEALRHRPAMKRITLGAFFGPFLGVSFSLAAVQYTTSGVAATIMSIVPVLIIPAAILIFKEQVSLRAIIGALIAVGGVALLFL